ncbi:MAG: hypothetical protein N5831_00880 [Lactobacillus crispatus]|nr:hypothetical protein [Lactobacillus crispatus]
MKKGSLWLVSILLILLGVMVYWDHGFKDFGRPGMILTSVLLVLTILIAFFATVSDTFNSWIGSWWVVQMVSYSVLLACLIMQQHLRSAVLLCYLSSAFMSKLNCMMIR